MLKRLFLFSVLSMVVVSYNATASESHSKINKDSDDYFLIHRPSVDLSKLEDPFYSHLLKMEIKSKVAMEKLNSLNKRKKEPLEAFELESLKISGIYTISHRRYVTIEDNLGHGYTLKTGNYLGRNNGIIKSIGKRNIVILEKILTPTGSLKNIKKTLSLNEVQ